MGHAFDPDVGRFAGLAEVDELSSAYWSRSNAVLADCASSLTRFRCGQRSPRADDLVEPGSAPKGWEAVGADLAERHADELEARIVRLRALAAELRA